MTRSFSYAKWPDCRGSRWLRIASHYSTAVDGRSSPARSPRRKARVASDVRESCCAVRRVVGQESSEDGLAASHNAQAPGARATEPPSRRSGSHLPGAGFGEAHSPAVSTAPGFFQWSAVARASLALMATGYGHAERSASPSTGLYVPLWSCWSRRPPGDGPMTNCRWSWVFGYTTRFAAW